MAKFGISVAVTAESTEKKDEYDNLPNGTYRLELSAAEIKRSDDWEESSGKVGFKATFDVVDPEEYRGRKIFTYYNLKNPNPDAQERGNKDFSRFRRAIGLGSIPEKDENGNEPEEQDILDEMRLVPFIATVVLGKPQYEKNAKGEPLKDASGNLIVKYEAQPTIKRDGYWYPDLDDAPPIGVTSAANDNKATAKVVAKPAAPAAAPKKKNPWDKSA